MQQIIHILNTIYIVSCIKFYKIKIFPKLITFPTFFQRNNELVYEKLHNSYKKNKNIYYPY